MFSFSIFKFNNSVIFQIVKQVQRIKLASSCICYPDNEGFSGGSVVKNLPVSEGDAGRHGFDPWFGKIPWRRAWQPTPMFLPGRIPWTEEPGGLQSMELKEWDTTK